jgi:hypothetical protein
VSQDSRARQGRNNASTLPPILPSSRSTELPDREQNQNPVRQLLGRQTQAVPKTARCTLPATRSHFLFLTAETRLVQHTEASDPVVHHRTPPPPRPQRRYRYVTARESAAGCRSAPPPSHPITSFFSAESHHRVRLRAILRRRRRRRRVHTPSLHHSLSLSPLPLLAPANPSHLHPDSIPVLPPSHRSLAPPAISTHPESLIHFCFIHHQPSTLLPPHHVAAADSPSAATVLLSHLPVLSYYRKL